jgi:hypothetical protein
VTSLLWGGAHLVPVRWLQLRLRSSVRRFLRCSYWYWWRLRSFIWCLRQFYLQELVTAPPTVLSRFALTHPLHFPVAPRRLGGAVRSFAAVPEQTLEESEDRVEERGWRGRGRMEMEDGDGKPCASPVRACLLVCLSAPAFALYLVSMGICWLRGCRRDSC